MIQVAFTDQWRRATESGKKLASEGTCECCYKYSLLTYIGKGLSKLKEHLMQTKIKTRMSNCGLELS